MVRNPLLETKGNIILMWFLGEELKEGALGWRREDSLRKTLSQ